MTLLLFSSGVIAADGLKTRDSLLEVYFGAFEFPGCLGKRKLVHLQLMDHLAITARADFQEIDSFGHVEGREMETVETLLQG